MLSRRGARVVHGPTMSTTLLDDLDATIAATTAGAGGAGRRRGADDRDRGAVVVRRGRERRAWATSCKHALGAGLVVARGPKAQSAARAAGLEVAWTAPTETNAEVLARLTADGVAGRRVVVQRDGGAPLFADALAELAPREVVDVPVYRWNMPDDATPAIRLLEAATDRQLDAVTFTCSYAVHNAFELSRDPAALAGGVRRGRAGGRRRPGHRRRPARGGRQPGRRAGAGPARVDGARPRRLPRGAGVGAAPRRRRGALAGPGPAAARTAPRSS